ncbi:hypothetical protein UFOVP679_6 [uncultured Caudovirales phage]|uniref:Uncharacterized protein n=1 Tax=uncultured Caudovirales phage TaxID=2100421 RepID=A0A6J5NET7_9CAUD|nr:hypothetical protein UFOVP679_6 [uncultured Caudovirales phage]
MDQDPLPEANWTFRRWLTFVLTAVSLGLVAWIIHKLNDGGPLAGVAYGLISLCALVVTYYLIAPSAEHITRIIQSAAIVRGGQAPKDPET